VPGGLVLDRLGVARSLLICLVVMIAANLIPFIAPESLSLAIAMRVVLGLVTGAFFLVMVKIIKILTPPMYVARMQGMHGAAFCFGSLAPYLYLPLTGPYGWIAAYLSGAILCVAVGVCMFRLPLEQLRETRETVGFSRMMQAMKEIATSKTIWLIGCCHGFFFGTINTFGNWLPSILADIRANSTPEDWATATGAMLFVGTMGRMFGSEIMGRMTRWQLITRVIFLVGVFYWILAFCGNSVLFFCLCLVLALLCGLTFASVFTLLIDIALPAYVFSTMGFMNMLANGVNILLILLWGTVREYTGNFSYGLCVSGTCALAVWLWARKQDPEKALAGQSPP
jgi:MFS family permease